MSVFFAFWLLIFLTITNRRRLENLWIKSWQDWILDITGLLFQGFIIPFLQITLVYQLYSYLFPHWQGCLTLHPIISFIVSFVVIDYLYYWNHRLLHSPLLWHLHQVHHTVTDRNVLGTSRNTIWTSFLIIYLWFHGLFIYLIANPNWYIAGVSLTAILDLWRHSEIEPRKDSFLYRLLSPWLILPWDHAWHHSNNSEVGNYGANFKLWDRIYGTNYKSDRLPVSLGITTKLNLLQKLFFPF